MEIWAAIVGVVLGFLLAEGKNWVQRRRTRWVLVRRSGAQWVLKYVGIGTVLNASVTVDPEPEHRLQLDFRRGKSHPIPGSLNQDQVITIHWMRGVRRFTAVVTVRGDRVEVNGDDIRRDRAATRW